MKKILIIKLNSNSELFELQKYLEKINISTLENYNHIYDGVAYFILYDNMKNELTYLSSNDVYIEWEDFKKKLINE